MSTNKNYHITVLSKIKNDKNIPQGAKLLFAEILTLSKEKGYCWATNHYFSELYCVSKRTVTRWISVLCELGYVSEKFVLEEGKSVKIRYLQINELDKNVYPPRQECLPPLDKNVQDNNKINNKYNIYTTESFKKTEEKVFEENSDPYLLAKFLERNILEHTFEFPKSEEQLQTWAKDIDLMIRKDGIDPDDIAEVIDWSHKDPFWFCQILSGKKLREKYCQLRMRMRGRYAYGA